MIALAKPDRVKLSKLLGLLGELHGGERDAAGRAAHRLVQQRGLSWEDVLLDPPNDREEAFPRGSWRDVCARCLQRAHELGEWELRFLRNVSRFPRLSAKQLRVLDEIADRVLGGQS